MHELMGGEVSNTVIVESCLWSHVALIPLAISIFVLRYPAVTLGLLLALAAGWFAASTCILLMLYNNIPASRGRRRSIGRAKKTALEMACLLAAVATRYSIPYYDPYSSGYFSEASVNMYYYSLLILATHQVYGFLKAFRLPPDVGFGDLWSVTLMENLIYWVPASSTTAQVASFALCSAAVAYSYGYHPSSNSIIPDGFASYLGSALGIVLFGVPLLCSLLESDRERAARMMIIHLFSLLIGGVYLLTGAMRWTIQKACVHNESVDHIADYLANEPTFSFTRLD